MKREEKHNDTVYITSQSSAHMSSQIRAKQLATKSSQDKLNTAIIQRFEEIQDISGEVLIKGVVKSISSWLELVKQINFSFAPKEELANIGFPIKFNKTALQLEMALSWIEQREISLITDLEHCILYNSLPNVNGIDQLPALQSPSKSAFWGNENPSVSTVLLYSVASSLGISVEPQDLMGAATFYPFFKSDYAIKDISNNPFVFEKGMVLFGDYQFGGHRYFSNEYPNLGQRLFSPEDCSSAVGKANNLTERQIVGLNTSILKAAYTNPTNEYGYEAITSSYLGEKLDYELIEFGDTYVRGGHTAIISGKDNFGNIQTLEFNRDIDIVTDKRLGGGAYEYNLFGMPTESEVYILRGSEPPLKEACSLSDLLTQVDRNYYQFYETTQRDIRGDCNIFLI